jgi:hypothetical protein
MSEVKLKNGYFTKGEPLGITDKYGTPLHSGDLVAGMYGSMRSLENTFGQYKIIGTRMASGVRRVLCKQSNPNLADQEFTLRQEWCIFVKSYLDE